MNEAEVYRAFVAGISYGRSYETFARLPDYRSLFDHWRMSTQEPVAVSLERRVDRANVAFDQLTQQPISKQAMNEALNKK